MFSSSGYFKGAVCPYFVSGLCERPHCHFRHVQPERPRQNEASTRMPDMASNKPSMLGMMGSAILQVQRSDASRQAPTYNPTPIRRNSQPPALSRPGNGLPQAAPKYLPPKNTPLYNPTPIRLLQAQNKISASKDENLSPPVAERTRITLGEAEAKAATVPFATKRPSTDDSSASEIKRARISSEEKQSSEMKDDVSEQVADSETSANSSATPDLKQKTEDLCSTGHNLLSKKSDSGTENHKHDSENGLSESRKNIFDILTPAIKSEESVVKRHEPVKKIKEELPSLYDKIPCTIKPEQSTDNGASNSKLIQQNHTKISETDMVQEEKTQTCECSCKHKNSDVSIERPDEPHKETSPVPDPERNSPVRRSASRSPSHPASRPRKRSHSSHSHSEKHSSSRHSKSSYSPQKTERHSKSSSHSHSKSSRRHSQSLSTDQDSHRHSKHSDSRGSNRSSHSRSDSHKSYSKSRSHRTNSRSRSDSRHSRPRSDSKSKADRHRNSSYSSSSKKSSQHITKSSCNSSESTHRFKSGQSRQTSSHTSDSYNDSDDDSNQSSDPSCSKVSQGKFGSSNWSKNDPGVVSCKKEAILPQSDCNTLPRQSSRAELFGSDSDDDTVSSTVMNIELQADEAVESDGDSIITLSSCDSVSDQINLITTEADDDNDDSPAKIHVEESMTKSSILEVGTGFGSSDADDDLPIQLFAKKRLAHQASSKALSKTLAKQAKVKLTPAQVMMKRFHQAQQDAKQQQQTIDEDERERTAVSPDSSSPSLVSSLSKSSRVAHKPKTKVVKRPIVTAEASSKVPTNIRQRYLNLFCDELVNLHAEESDAYDQAVEEEKEIYTKSMSRNIYLNKAVAAIKKLRDKTNPQTVPSLDPSLVNPKALSHEAVLGGSKAAHTSYTIKRSSINRDPQQLTAELFYERLLSHKLSEEALIDNGFPHFLTDDHSEVTMKKSDRAIKSVTSNTNERICVRCGKRFEVLDDGRYARRDSCVYHWGKSWKRRVCGAVENRFTCCQQDAGAKGCQVAECHVHDYNKYSDLHGYMSTIATHHDYDRDHAVYSLDCEMVYTTVGLELARVTVIDQNMESIVELLVRPDNPVLDYNTRFSGITAADMHGVDTKLEDVQEVLLGLFTDSTVLLGHSLESDLLALKMVHSSVVDTSVVFPHKLGPPYKRALKTLMAENLKKIIQEDEGGHDSKEDASACMQLMVWKVKEELKKSQRPH